MRRPFFLTTSSYGRKTVWSTPTGTTVSRSSGTCICALMSILELCETVRTAGSCFDRAHLHAQEAEPAPRRVALPGGLGVIERDRAVDGDRVVQRLEQRPALAGAASRCPVPCTGCRG